MSDVATLIWTVCGLAAAIAVAVELGELQWQRGLLLHDRPRRRILIHSVREGLQMRAATPQQAAAQPPAPPASVEATPEVPRNDTNGSRRAATPRATGVQEGIIYIDADGHCTFINQAARELLQWNDGNLSLGDILAGGAEESTALIEALKRQGLIEQHTTALAAARWIPLELSAVALRDRDDNLWGAAVFIHTPASASGLPPGPEGESQA